MVGGISRQPRQLPCHIDGVRARAGTPIWGRNARAVGGREAVFEAIGRFTAIRVDRAVERGPVRVHGRCVVGTDDGRPRARAARGAPTGRAVVTELGEAQVSGFGRTAAVAAFADVEQLAFGAYLPEERGALRSVDRIRESLDPRKKRRGHARSAEEMPTVVGAVGVVDGYGRLRVGDGGDIGHRALGTACVALPGGLFLVRAAAAAGSRPRALPPAAGAFVFAQAGPAHSDHVRGGGWVGDSVARVSRGEQNWNAGVIEIWI